MDHSPAQTKRTFFHDAAVVAIAAPILAMVLNVVLNFSQATPNNWWRTVPPGLMYLGLITAVLALIGGLRPDRRKLMLPGIIGLILSGGLIALSATIRRQVQTAVVNAERELMDYPSWNGGGEVMGASFSLISIDENTPSARGFSNLAGTNVAVLTIAVDNTRGTNTITFDPARLELLAPSGPKTRAVPAATLLANLKGERDKMIAKFGATAVVPPGQLVADLAAFFPGGTDFSKIMGVAIPIGTNIALLQGQYLLAEQKRQLQRGVSNTSVVTTTNPVPTQR